MLVTPYRFSRIFCDPLNILCTEGPNCTCQIARSKYLAYLSNTMRLHGKETIAKHSAVTDMKTSSGGISFLYSLCTDIYVCNLISRGNLGDTTIDDFVSSVLTFFMR